MLLACRLINSCMAWLLRGGERKVYHPHSTTGSRAVLVWTPVRKNRVSPFRLRLRIALTYAGAIEGEGGRGGPPSVEPELSFLTNTNFYTAGERRPLSAAKRRNDLVAAEGRAGCFVSFVFLSLLLRPKAALGGSCLSWLSPVFIFSVL